MNKKTLSDPSIYELHAEVCKALGHPLRIQVIDLLRDGELGFSEIIEITGVSKSSLSQQLSVMVSKGILKQRRDGLHAYFRLSSPKVAKACSLMREVLIESLKSRQKLLAKL